MNNYRRPFVVDSFPGIIELDLWTPQQEFLNMRELVDVLNQYFSEFFLMNEGFMAVFDMTQRETFEDLPPIIDAIARVKKVQHLQQIPIIVVANKVDKATERKVTTQEAKSWANSIGAEYMETSALSGVNVNEAFATIVRTIRTKRHPMVPHLFVLFSVKRSSKEKFSISILAQIDQKFPVTFGK